MITRKLTICGLPSFSRICLRDRIWPDSKAPSAASCVEGRGDLGLNKCSNIAMIRNRDIKIAVATKPKEMAFTEVPKSFQGASLSSAAVCDGVGLALVYTFHDFDLSEEKLFMFLPSWTVGCDLCLRAQFKLLKHTPFMNS